MWQRNYYEHIIRNEKELERIRDYIQTNPLRWHVDQENPDRVGDAEADPWQVLAGANRWAPDVYGTK